MENCVVVGGGLCGLFSSILLADKFKNVYIIDIEKVCGGLLKSTVDDKGIIYDQGTHIPNTTMIPEIDNILFGPEEERHKNWNNLGPLKTGNYFGGKWNFETQCTDTRLLPKDIYDKGMMELLQRTEPSTATDIATYLIETIGPTFTNEVVVPLAQKLYGEKVDVGELVKNSSVSYFGLGRIMGLSQEVTYKLKEIKAFDVKLGYHTNEEHLARIKKDGTPQTTYYYPKHNKGVQHWVDHLIQQAKDKGVIFLNEESVSKINHSNNTITSVELRNSKKTLECDFLFWSAPTVFALNAAGMEFEKANIAFKTANIFHFNFDRPHLNTHSHYVWNWDKSSKGFRITFFPNLREDDLSSGIYNLTIEALSDAHDAEEITTDQMLRELIDSGVVSKEAKVLSHARQTIHNTFPIPTFEFVNATEKNYKILSKSFHNIMLSGRFSGKQWLHADVLTSAYTDINNRFS